MALLPFLLQIGSALLQPCHVPRLETQARCATIQVPESRGIDGGRRIALSVVVVPATDPNAAGAPIVFLPGGPGGDIIDQAATWTEFAASSLGQHPLLFIDPRGTGRSHALGCQLASDPRRVVTHVRDFLPIAQVRACRRRLEERADLTQYTTEHVAADLDAVRAALGFERLILMGMSGGTRQSLVYLKRYPERVEAMILMGTVPLSFRMPMYYAVDAQAAFDSLAVDCARDAACARTYPRLREQLRSVLATLDRRPARVELRTADGSIDTAIVTRGIFAERLRTSMYTAGGASHLPYVIDRAAAGDYNPVVQLSIPGLRPPRRDVVAMGHFLSVTCTEDVARVSQDTARTIARKAFLGTYRVDQQTAACRVWPKATLPADHFTPVRSGVPVLFLSGDADPVTPPRWADSAARDLPNSAHAIFAHQGHGSLTSCASRMVSEFLGTRRPKDLDLSCARATVRPSFFGAR